MSKKSRRKQSHRTPHEVARAPQPPARRKAATSSSWTDIDYRSADEPVSRPSTRVSRAHKTPPAPQRPSRRAVPSSLALFGPWTLPTLQPTAKKAATAVKTTCTARSERRQVMFATRTTGTGAQAPRRNFTNKRCK